MIVDELDVKFVRKNNRWARIKRLFSILAGMLKEKR